jgi:hypothetical protein
VTVSSGNYTSAGAALVSGSGSVTIPAGSLPAGSDTLTASYTPDAASSSNYYGGSGTAQVTVTKATPSVTVVPAFSSITTVQSLSVSVTVSGGAGASAATGSVTLTSGSFTSAAAALTSGSVQIVIPAGSLAVGTDTLTANYTPDTAGSPIYNGATGQGSVTVSLVTPAVTVTPGSSTITVIQPLSVTVTVSGGSGNPMPTGAVTLKSGSYTSSSTTLTNGSASITIPANSLATGNDTLTASYTPDASSSSTYASASGTGPVTVNSAKPTVTVTPGSSSIMVNQPLAVTVTVSGGSGSPTPTGSVTLTSGSYTSAATTLSSGSASINVPANSLAIGNDTLTASYTPDASSSSTYTSSAGTGSVTVTSSTLYVLTVDSVAPSSGVPITVSPADNNSKSGGTTPFTLTYYGGSQVTLSAPLSNNGYSFVSWGGCTSTSGTSGSNCIVTLNANTTVTATYNQPTITSITVTPSAATIGTQQQFTATVHGTGNYSSGVAWSVAAPTGSTLSPGDISSTGLYNTPYPAPATVTVTATSTMSGFTNVSGSVTVTLNPPATTTGPALSVDVNTPNTPSENPHTISPYVYGMNAYVLDPASEKIANPGLLRWGGDDTSRYNYQNNMTNSASDYYFENFLGAASQFPNASSSTNFTQFVQSTSAAGSTALGTVPVLGWVANSTQYACSFTNSQFPGQQSYNSNNCGNGVYPQGTNGCTSSSGCDIYGNNTIAAITSIQETPPSITSAPAPGSVTSTWADGTWSGGWVNSIVTNYGNGASGKGVAIWDLDNEPTWWDAVHRDVHPVAFTYDEVTNNGLGTALAIKTADSTALVSGPVIDWWWAYFYSKKDIENGWSSGPCYEPWSGPTDREAHAGVPLIGYYLQQFKSYSQQYGVRLLDYVDIHGYFAPDYNGNSVAFTTAGDTQEQEARMNGTRVFWDPTYTDPNYPQPNYLTDSNYTTSCSPPAQAPQLIPMLKAWVNGTAPLGNPNYDYPGTKTGIDEYNFGGLESISGAVVQADILGIFGRQGLDMSAFWPTTNYSSQGPGNYSFGMFRNYDGNNSTFGDTYLYATSMTSGADAESQLAVYGAQRSSDKTITIMVINKTYGSLTSTISLENFTAPSGTMAQVYQYSNTNLSAIVQPGAVSVTPPSGSGTTSTISGYTFPAQSITLFVIPD